jgi:hypothetical protein
MFKPARRKACGFFLVNASQTNGWSWISMRGLSHTLQEEPMPLQRPTTPAILLAGLIGALWLTNAVAASGTAAPQGPAQHMPAKVSFIDAPSAESPVARSKRLKRECKGRPNAGACLGHTH